MGRAEARRDSIRRLSRDDTINRLASRFWRFCCWRDRCRLDKSALDRQEKILDAALDVFAEHGYQQATVDEIASTARTSKGGVYFHFPGKDAIFLALLDRSASCCWPGSASGWPPSPIRSPKLTRPCWRWCRCSGRIARWRGCSWSSHAGPAHASTSQLATVQSRYAAFLQQQLDEAVASGLCQPSTPRLRVRPGSAHSIRSSQAWALADRPRPLEETYPHLRALLLRSIGLPDR